jgi:hypothetical protein
MSLSKVALDGDATSCTSGLKNNHLESKNLPLTWTTFSNVIDGKLETTKEARCGINPATEQNNPSVPVASKEDVDRAMSAAQKAFKPWAAVPYAERQKAFLAFADGLEAENEAFSKFLTQEQGKPASFHYAPFPSLVSYLLMPAQLQFARVEIDAAMAWMRATASLELPIEKTDAAIQRLLSAIHHSESRSV